MYIAFLHLLFPSPRVLLEEVVLPALARPGDEEPVVVEPHLVAAELVLAVAVGRGSPAARSLPLRKVRIVILKSI